VICAIVLAAGCSSRMGTQKLLLPLGQQTVISHIITQVLSGNIESVYVVVGHQAKELTNELSGQPVSTIHNPEYQSGMLSSVRAGLRNIPAECRAVLVVLGDQPSITAEIIKQMIQTFNSTKKTIIVPVYDGKRGHPLLFSTIYRDEILTKFDEVGLRGILEIHDEEVLEMGVTDSAVLSDMDYPEDYRREIEKYENMNKKER
jgi:molybdenum cofactor cytidylyltransferase